MMNDMKLTEKPIKSSDKEKLNDNAIFNAFQASFSNVFGPVPYIDNSRCSVDENGFRYDCTESESLFYNNQYICLRRMCQNINTLGINWHDNINLEQIGEAKRCLLDFVYNSANVHTLQFEGNRGWGKTTILRFLFFHIIPMLNQVNNIKIVPIYLSMNRHINDYKGLELKRDTLKVLYGSLSDAIDSYYHNDLSNINNDFWLHITSKYGFNKYKISLGRIEKMNCSAQEKEDKKWSIYDEILRSRDAKLHAFSYFVKQHNSIPLIILDDLDPLDTPIVQILFDEIYRIANTFSVKVIYTIRPSTAKKISRMGDYYTSNQRYVLSKPELFDVYLENCINQLIQKINKFSHIEITLDTKKVSISDATQFYLNFLKILKQDRSRHLLESLSDGDIRLYNQLVKTCVQSGLINSEELITKLLDVNFDQERSVPYWIIYTSIITQNHKLLFREVKANNNEHIINLLCNGGSTFNKHLIRLHLLSFFVKRGNADNSLNEISDYYNDLFNKKYNSRVKSSIQRAIKKFNNSSINDKDRMRLGLISNEDQLFIKNNSDIEKQEYKITDVGNYYFDELITTFEYLSYMKDDVDYPEAIAEQIKNNIEAKYQQQRFDEVTKYLRFLFEQEKDFIDPLTTNQLQTYKDSFSPWFKYKKWLFSELFVDKMIEYGNATWRDSISNLSEINSLKAEISSYLCRKKINE
jgi:hypothetical protein